MSLPFIYCSLTNRPQNAGASNNNLSPFLMVSGLSRAALPLGLSQKWQQELQSWEGLTSLGIRKRFFMHVSGTQAQMVATDGRHLYSHLRWGSLGFPHSMAVSQQWTSYTVAAFSRLCVSKVQDRSCKAFYDLASEDTQCCFH